MRIPKPILERRRSVRIDDALPFRVGLEGFEQEASTINISSTGAMCLLDKEIPMMTKLRMAVSLESKKTLHLKGVVVRKEKDLATDKFQVAIFFSEISASDREALERYIAFKLRQ